MSDQTQIQEKDYVRLERTAKAMRADFTHNRPSAVVQRKVKQRLIAILDFDVMWEKFQPRPTDRTSYVYHNNPADWQNPTETMSGRIDIYAPTEIQRGTTVAIDVVEVTHAKRSDGKNLNDSDAELITETREYLRMWEHAPIPGLDMVFKAYSNKSETTFGECEWLKVLRAQDDGGVWVVYAVHPKSSETEIFTLKSFNPEEE